MILFKGEIERNHGDGPFSESLKDWDSFPCT